MQDLLVATVIHDLKNELGILTGSLSTMVKRAAGTAIEEDARNSYAIATKLSQNLVSFLTMYRAEQRGLMVRSTDHNPEDFLRDLAAEIVLVADAPLVNVELKEPLAPYWFFDAYLVQMGIEAAVQNALRFAKTTITLSARMRDGFLVFQVADDGAGLGAEAAPSTGLGTVLCTAIAQAHQNDKRTGKVVMENLPEGGASFEMWLP